MRKSSLKIKDEIAVKQARGQEIINLCKTEVRDLTEEEEKEVDALKQEIKELKKELDDCKARAEALTFDTEEEEKDSRSEDNEEGEQENENNDAQEKEQEEKSENRNMNKKQFSLARALRSIVDNKPLNAVDAAYIEEGKKEARAAGVECQGQVVLPETRGVITVATEGEDIVETEIKPLLMPLRPEAVLRQAGMKYVSGLRGDLQYPTMTKSNVFFEGETADAQDGAGTFGHVTLSPKRVTAYVDVSRKALIQAAENVDLENAIIADLQKAIEEKVESAFLSDFSGSTTQYEGIFSVVEPTSGISTFAGLVDLEANVDDANVQGECVYILSNKTKAALRAMAKSAKSTELVYESGEVDGTKAFNTSMIGTDKKFIYGDFSNSVCGTWGTSILVDPYTQATKSTVRIIAEVWVDMAVLREGAFVTGELA